MKWHIFQWHFTRQLRQGKLPNKNVQTTLAIDTGEHSPLIPPADFVTARNISPVWYRSVSFERPSARGTPLALRDGETVHFEETICQPSFTPVHRVPFRYRSVWPFDMDRDVAFRRLLVALPTILAVGICTVDGLICLFSEKPARTETGNSLKPAGPPNTKTFRPEHLAGLDMVADTPPLPPVLGQSPGEGELAHVLRIDPPPAPNSPTPARKKS